MGHKGPNGGYYISRITATVRISVANESDDIYLISGVLFLAVSINSQLELSTAAPGCERDVRKSPPIQVNYLAGCE